jgi:hypothetical protein
VDLAFAKLRKNEQLFNLAILIVNELILPALNRVADLNEKMEMEVV